MENFRSGLGIFLDSRGSPRDRSTASAVPFGTPQNNMSGRLAKDDFSQGPATLSRDFTTQQQRLTTWAGELSAMIVPSILATCLSYDRVCRWDKKETQSHMLIPFMVDVLLRIKQGSSPAKDLDLSSVFEQVKTLLEEQAGVLENEGGCQGYLHGLMYFLNQLTLDTTVRRALTESNRLTRDRSAQLVGTVVQLIQCTTRAGGPQLPGWISPAMLLLYELLSLPGTTSGPMVTAATTVTAASAAWDEKEETGDLAESKMDASDQVSKPPALANSTAVLLNEVQLLPDSARSTVFDLVVGIINACPTSKLDAESMQGVLIVLLTLLNDQTLVGRFVRLQGLVKLLEVTSAESVPENRLAQFRVITLIVRRCMETEVELDQTFSERIAHFVRLLQGEDKCVPFNAFIQALTADLLRSPDDFWRACKHTVKIIKVQSVRKSERSHPQNKPEIKVRLLEGEPVHDYLTLRVKEGEPDHRAYATLKALMRHIVLSVLQRKTMTFASVEEKVCHLLTVSGALNALADAILSLRRVPILVARVIRCECESIGLSTAENFVDFLIGRLGAESVSIAEDGVPTAANVINPDLTASSRLLVALCAFKGPSRVLALTSVLKNFRAFVLPPAPVTSKSDASDATHASETHRVQMVSRFASLLSILIRASKTTSKDGSSTKGEGVSVDTLHFLIEHGQILQLLTQALASLPVQLQMTSAAVTSIMDLMDLITRPKILAHLDKITAPATSGEKAVTKRQGAHVHTRDSSQTSETEGDAHTSGTEHGADEIFMMGTEDGHSGFGSSSQRSASPGDGLIQGHRFVPSDFHGHDAEEDDSESSGSSEEDDEDDEDDEDEDEDEDGDEVRIPAFLDYFLEKVFKCLTLLTLG
jgi:hypothetical protein